MSYTPTPLQHQRSRGLNETRITVPMSKFSTLPRSFASEKSSRQRPPLNSYPIVVHSHLHWDWVWQRPQQFLSRLSKRHRVLFVETRAPDPNLVSPLARWENLESFPNLTLLKIQFPAWRWEDADFVDLERRRLVQEAVNGPLAGQFEKPVQWFYDPMAVTAFNGHL